MSSPESPHSPEVTAYLTKKSEGQIPLPEPEAIPVFVGEFSERIAEISNSWNPVEIYTAETAGVAREKTAFIEAYNAGEQYNPEFTYPVAERMATEGAAELDEARVKLQGILSELRTLPIDREDKAARLARRVLYAKAKDDLATVNLIEGIATKDEEKIRVAINEKYQPLDPYLLSVAYQHYEAYTKPKDAEAVGPRLVSEEQEAVLREMVFTPEETKAAFVWALEKMGVPLIGDKEKGAGFRVTISEEATAIDVRDKSAIGQPTIVVPTKRETPLHGVMLLELLSHEIGAHVRQSTNGQIMFGGLGGGSMKVDDETMYEGLAMRNENDYHREFFGKVDDEYPVFPYALAVETAANGGSFHEVFARQLDVRLHLGLKLAPDQALPPKEEIPKKIYDFAETMAWRTTYRVMRGHTDTSNKAGFAMTKDLGYLRGMVLDEELQEAGIGHINEAAVLKSGGLQALAYFKIDEVAIHDRPLAKEYWEEVLRDKVDAELARKALQSAGEASAEA